MLISQIKSDDKNHKLIVDVIADEKKWSDILTKITNKFIKTAKIKGYRAGYVPFNIALKQVKTTEFYHDAIKEIIDLTLNELTNSKTISNHNIIEDSPKINVLEIHDNKVKIKYEFDISPTVTLGDYKKALLSYVEPTITDLEIENQLCMFLKKIECNYHFKTLDIVDKGSSVIIDYEGKIDDKPFPGSCAKNYNLVVGSEEFFPGFEEKLKGHKIGETIKFKLILPLDFYLSDLAGKKVDYIVTIKEKKDDVFFTLSDDFIKSLCIKNVNTIDQLKESFRKKILAQKLNIQYQQVVEKIINILSKESKVDFIPPTVIDYQKRIITSQYRQMAKNMKISLEAFVRNDQSIKDMDTFYKLVEEKAIENINLMFSIDKLIDEYKIECTKEETNAILNNFSAKYNLSIDEVKTKFSNQYEMIVADMMKQKLFKKIINIKEPE